MTSEQEIAESLAGHLARNAALLSSVRGKGVDVTKTHTVDHHFWAPEQSTAAALGAELYSRGYLVIAISPAKNDVQSTIWNVQAQVQRTLEEAGSATTTEDLVRFAARFDSVYDGWGSAIG